MRPLPIDGEFLNQDLKILYKYSFRAIKYILYFIKTFSVKEYKLFHRNCLIEFFTYGLCTALASVEGRRVEGRRGDLTRGEKTAERARLFTYSLK